MLIRTKSDCPNDWLNLHKFLTITQQDGRHKQIQLLVQFVFDDAVA